MNATEDPIVDERVEVKPVKRRNLDAEKFIKDNLPILNRVITKINCHQLTPSYWRVNVWGKKLNSTCAFGDNEIVMSKFVRIDIDKDGKMVYNDVTSGKEL